MLFSARWGYVYHMYFSNQKAIICLCKWQVTKFCVIFQLILPEILKLGFIIEFILRPEGFVVDMYAQVAYLLLIVCQQ